METGGEGLMNTPSSRMETDATRPSSARTGDSHDLLLGVEQDAAFFLTRANLLDLLQLASPDIVVPAPVADEILREGHEDPGARTPLGLILLAKQRGRIDAARPILEAMRASGMYLSDAVLKVGLLRRREVERVGVEGTARHGLDPDAEPALAAESFAASRERLSQHGSEPHAHEQPRPCPSPGSAATA
jgi:hypothetical protein